MTASPQSEHEAGGVGHLLKTALDDVQELVKIDIALAKQEVRHDLTKLEGAAIAFGVAAAGALLSLSMLLVALLFAIGGGAGAALVAAAALLVLTLVAGGIGYRLVPRSPVPERTVKDVEEQAAQLKARLA
jgi:hypothetical protein